MAKIYLFRKVSAVTHAQEAVYEEAAKAVVRNVLTGDSGTILNYGQLSLNGGLSLESNSNEIFVQDIIARIVTDIFNLVYTLELTMEVHITIEHHELSVEKLKTFQELFDNNLNKQDRRSRLTCLKSVKEQFVSAPKDVFDFIEKQLVRLRSGASSTRCNSIFIVNVKQSNLEKTKRVSGKLFLVNFTDYDKCVKSIMTAAAKTAGQEDTPLIALFKVVLALADNSKTHIRYHNIRLTRILKDILSGVSGTVILNYFSYVHIDRPIEDCFNHDFDDVKVSDDELNTLDELKQRYEDEKILSQQLMDKLKQLELQSQTRSQVESEPANPKTTTVIDVDTKLDDNVDGSSTSSEQAAAHLNVEIVRLYQQLDKKDDELRERRAMVSKLRELHMEQAHIIKETRTEIDLLKGEMEQIQRETRTSMDDLKELLKANQELQQNYEQNMKEIKKKDDTIKNLTGLLKTATDELAQIKRLHSEKKKCIRDTLTELWRSQAAALESQELQRAKELQLMFDMQWRELQTSMEKVQMQRMSQMRDESVQVVIDSIVGEN